MAKVKCSKTELACEILKLRGTEDDIELFKILYRMNKSDLEARLMLEMKRQAKMKGSN